MREKKKKRKSDEGDGTSDQASSKRILVASPALQKTVPLFTELLYSGFIIFPKNLCFLEILQRYSLSFSVGRISLID